jgi:hypothetical protein
MLVFKDGIWHEVTLPDYVDPSWGVTERSHAAYGILKGLDWKEIEAGIYSGLLSIFGKKHRSPEDKKK